VIYDESLVDSLTYASHNNWNGIVPDIGVPIFSPHMISTEDRVQLRDMARNLSIEWGFHAPADDVSLMSTYPQIRAGILAYYKQVINLAREVSVGPTNVVIHPGTTPTYRKAGNEPTTHFREKYRENYTTTLHENLLELLEHARPHVRLVIENVSWTPHIREVIENLIPKGLKLCLDIPKLYGADLKIRNDDWNLFQRFRSSIEVVHIHDLIPQIGGHQVVGNGLIDFEPTLRFLSSLQSKPQYVFEVRPREEAQRSLASISKMMSIFDIDL
jgi:sugar phosphate isomerase/epimerase